MSGNTAKPTADAAAAARKRDLATIHIARGALGMDEDEYRDMLFALCRVRSAKDLDWTGRRKVLNHFKRLGWPKPAKRSSKQSKLLLLWHQLAEVGAVADGSAAALNAFCKRQTGIDRIEFVDASPSEFASLVESLKSWLARVHGGRMELARAVTERSIPSPTS